MWMGTKGMRWELKVRCEVVWNLCKEAKIFLIL